MALATSYPFGMREISLKPINASTGVIGAAIFLPNSRKMTFSEVENFVALRGGDKTVTSRGTGATCDWELEGGGISLEAYAAIAGGTVVTSGVTPNQKKTYKKLATDARPFFKAEGRSLTDEAGDFHVIIYRCRATKDIPGSLTDEEYLLTAASGQGFPSQEAGSIDALYDFIQNETPAVLA